MTLSKRRSLFAPPNLCGTLAVLTHADAQSLCAVRACSLSELRLLDSKGRRLLWPDASDIFSKHVSLFSHWGARSRYPS